MFSIERTYFIFKSVLHLKQLHVYDANFFLKNVTWFIRGAAAAVPRRWTAVRTNTFAVCGICSPRNYEGLSSYRTSHQILFHFSGQYRNYSVHPMDCSANAP